MFRASSTNNIDWWALACCRMYNLMGNVNYLEIAQAGEAFVHSYWDDLCCGGIYWDMKTTPEYKNAISIELIMKLRGYLCTNVLKKAILIWKKQ